MELGVRRNDPLRLASQRDASNGGSNMAAGSRDRREPRSDVHAAIVRRECPWAETVVDPYRSLGHHLDDVNVRLARLFSPERDVNGSLQVGRAIYRDKDGFPLEHDSSELLCWAAPG
jgi:hypothetical protein